MKELIQKALGAVSRYRVRGKLALFVAVFAGLGMAALMFIQALAPTGNLQPEKGQVIPPAAVKPDPNASGRKKVIFKPRPRGVRASIPGLPAQGALLGISSDAPVGSGFEKLENAAHINRKFDFHVTFTDFNSPSNGMIAKLNRGNVPDDLQKGRIPLLTWQMASFSRNLKDYIVPDIVAGKHDAYIAQAAERVKSLQKPIYIRLGHEMNSNWYGWSGCWGNNCRPDSTSNYVQAYRRIHDIFKARNVANAVWIWCPNGNDVPNIPGHHWTDYYPGDQYVDIVGIDQYVHKKGLSLGDVLNNGPNSIYGDYSGKKPIFIVETMSGPRPFDERYADKVHFFNHMPSVLQAKYPAVAGIAIFDHNKMAKGDGDYSIEITASAASNASNMAAFVAMTQNCYFGTDARQAACRGQ